MRKGIHKQLQLSCFIILSIAILFFSSDVFALSGQTVDLKVAKGDTLSNICEKYLESTPNSPASSKWRQIAKINRLKNPDMIHPEQVLKIPMELLKGTPLDGEVSFLKNDAKVQKKDSDDWVSLCLGDKIIQGSTIKTEGNSFLEITFVDGSAIFFKPNTTIGITTLQKKGLFAIIHDLYLWAGRTITSIKSATGIDSRFQIKTPSAVATARGTQFRLSFDEKASTRTEVLEGNVSVKAMDKVVEVKQGEGTLVEKDGMPVQPIKLLAPPEIKDYKTIYKDLPLSIEFDWIEKAAGIRAILSKDPQGKDIILEDTIKPKGSFVVSDIADGLYYLMGSSIDEKGLEGLSARPAPIKLRANPLPPIIQTKEKEVEFIGKSAEFGWLKVKDAVKYHVQVALDEDFTRFVEEQKDHGTQSYKTGVLDYNTYYFRVSSIAEDGYQGGWSHKIAFRLIPPPPVPQLEKPQMDKTSISMRWRDLGDGITYRFQMSDDETFKTVLIDERLQKPETTIQRPKDIGTHYVRTSSIDKKGRESDFSFPQSFEIERGFPYMQIGIIGTLGVLLMLLF